jgi:aspartate/methionine/tyrosine aminotransferase
MPKPGEQRAGTAAAALPGAVYTPFDLAAHPGPLFPLHVGDTWLEPAPGARTEDLREADFPGLHRYGPTAGMPRLVEALAARLRERSGLAPERGQVLVTAGATSGLACAVAALCDPGEEVLICAPFWPLIRGIVRAAGAVAAEVPFFDRVATPAEALAALDARTGPRTAALYFSNPSNPTGRVLGPAFVEALAAWARRRDLWILSDEVYDAFVYRGEHVATARFAPERTLTAGSFSKTYGMAGNRVGWLAGPAAALAEAHKLSVHSAYHAPTAAQAAALRALEGGAGWVKAARESYARVGREAAALLGVPEPEGSCFLFVDVAPRLDARGLDGFLADCFADGVVVAPGASAGEAYGSWVRLCYTALPPEAALEGVRRLAGRLGGRR